MTGKKKSQKKKKYEKPQIQEFKLPVADAQASRCSPGSGATSKCGPGIGVLTPCGGGSNPAG